tara:strand:- start:135 stop:503 length:369 start_codon:yes stop_codon:yes gene_type:complete
MSSHSITTGLSGEIKILEGLYLDYECVVSADVNVDHCEGDSLTPSMTDYEVTEITSCEFEYMSYFDEDERDLNLTEYCLRHGGEYHEVLQVVTDVTREYVEEQLNEYVSQNACDLIEYEPNI